MNNGKAFSVQIKTREDKIAEVELFIMQIRAAARNNTPMFRTRIEGKKYPREIRVMISENREPRGGW